MRASRRQARRRRFRAADRQSGKKTDQRQRAAPTCDPHGRPPYYCGHLKASQPVHAKPCEISLSEPWLPNRRRPVNRASRAGRHRSLNAQRVERVRRSCAVHWPQTLASHLSLQSSPFLAVASIGAESLCPGVRMAVRLSGSAPDDDARWPGDPPLLGSAGENQSKPLEANRELDAGSPPQCPRNASRELCSFAAL